MTATNMNPTARTPRATVRTYRHGLGDCHLISLFGPNRSTYRIMIDCGVILGTKDATTTMTAVMDDILAATGGKIDLLVATHEHWDHLSGFTQAASSFAKLEVGAVWMGWTEDANDPDAQKLRGQRDSALALLRTAAIRMQLDGSDEPNLLTSMLEFFGAAGGTTTKSALEAVRGKVASPRYCDPKDPPTELPAFGARIYVLGPPRDLTLLKKTLPSPSTPETYTIALQAFHETVVSALTASTLSNSIVTRGATPRAANHCST